MYFSNTRENAKNNWKDLLNDDNIILNKLSNWSGKCNPKTKAYFSFLFHLGNSKREKKYSLQIWIRRKYFFHTLECLTCLIDVPLLINFWFFSTQDILIPTPAPPINYWGKYPTQTNFETIYLYWRFCDLAKGTTCL